MKKDQNSDLKNFISGLEKEMDDSVVKETEHGASPAGNAVEMIDAKSLPRESKLARLLFIAAAVFIVVLFLMWH
ncbi:MAG: hypothetical protein FJX34_06140 [Alphaproteobacteria bacterium]|nr:hypothetical protein [Alphaproteobacteria bacterium]